MHGVILLPNATSCDKVDNPYAILMAVFRCFDEPMFCFDYVPRLHFTVFRWRYSSVPTAMVLINMRESALADLVTSLVLSHSCQMAQGFTQS